MTAPTGAACPAAAAMVERWAEPRRLTRIEAAGDWLRRNGRVVRALQWGMVAIYALLLIVPALLPMPPSAAHVWSDITLFAQFLFWGVWWPGVLISMIVFGRLWCGVLCPEGALSEFASRHGRGRAVPRWIRWPGWPFAAFVLTTVYGQMISVYQYPGAALLILGGSTLAAVAVGYLYGRNHRVWCRYLCPVNGVFGLLAKLAPLHYRVDAARWDATEPRSGRAESFVCAPMVPVRQMQSTSACHMCGRCAGFRDAVELAPRAPGSEVVTTSASTATYWDSLLILTGLMGVAVGAFLWSASPWFVAMAQGAASWLVGHGVLWPIRSALPWWVLTNHPARNDVMTLLDGAMMLAFIGAAAAVMTLALGLPLAAAARLAGGGWRWQRFHHFAQGLLPLAAVGVILGLSAQTVTLLRADGIRLTYLPEVRAVALALAATWSLWLMWRIAGRYAQGARRALAVFALSPALVAAVWVWVLMFWVW